MAVGNEASEGGVNASLTDLSLALRDFMNDVQEQYQFLNKLGASGLQALGFSPADAGQVLQMIDYMGTLQQIYTGQTTQPSLFNFEDALCSLWAGS